MTEAYIKRLIELKNKFRDNPENKEFWLPFLMGYIEALELTRKK